MSLFRPLSTGVSRRTANKRYCCAPIVLTESTVLHELADKVPFDVGTQLTDWIVVTVGSSVDTLSLNDVETLSVVKVVNWVAVGEVTHDMVVET